MQKRNDTRLLAVALGLGALLVTCWASGCSSQEDRIGFAGPSSIEAGSLVPSGTDASAVIDEHPDASLCAATECPSPYSTCDNSKFRCDKNLDSDGLNCGGCGIECPGADDTSVETVLHADWRCSSGACLMSCMQGFVDCNGNPGDGCEINTRCDADNCGGCGVKCADGVQCIAGTCGCPLGLTQCADAVCGPDDVANCKDFSQDDFNCGGCGNSCPQPDVLPPNMISGCGNGECGHLKCAAGFDDCNTLSADGCEVDLSKDPSNCGACGFKCADGQKCSGGECLCPPGAQLCEFGTAPDIESVCFHVDVDPNNCGACGRACPIPANGKAGCSDGRCELECPAGFADCDGNWSTGCETSVDSDPTNCGGCGIQCDVAAGQPCIRGQCALAPCPPGTVQ
jgi:hypothetical protein